MHNRTGKVFVVFFLFFFKLDKYAKDAKFTLLYQTILKKKKTISVK